MKKFVKNLILFSAFASLFYIMILSLWSWVMPFYMAKNVRNCTGCYGHLNTRVKEIPQYKDVDIIVLGSSHAYRGFDPRVFEEAGIKLFNLGSSSQSPIQSNVLLNQYIDDLNPKLVVLEVYAGTLGIDGVESSLDLAANNKMDWNYYKTLKDIRNLQTYNSTIYGSFRELFNLNEGFEEELVQEEDVYVNGGYVETIYRQNPMNDEKSRPWKIEPVQLKYLKENIEFLKRKEIPCLLMQTPITQKLYESRTNNEEVDSLLSELGSYKNFYYSLRLNDSLDFYDSNHLNQEAVVRFNKVFIDYLKQQDL